MATNKRVRDLLKHVRKELDERRRHYDRFEACIARFFELLGSKPTETDSDYSRDNEAWEFHFKFDLPQGKLEAMIDERIYMYVEFTSAEGGYYVNEFDVEGDVTIDAIVATIKKECSI